MPTKCEGSGKQATRKNKDGTITCTVCGKHVSPRKIGGLTIANHFPKTK